MTLQEDQYTLFREWFDSQSEHYANRFYRTKASFELGLNAGYNLAQSTAAKQSQDDLVRGIELGRTNATPEDLGIRLPKGAGKVASIKVVVDYAEDELDYDCEDTDGD